MAERILMIALSPTMENGTIASWVKKEGDDIANGDVICEVETDKATMEYESVQDGTLLKILVSEGETAEIEEPIGIIGKPNEDIAPLLEEIRREKKATAGESEKGVEEKAPSQSGGEDSGREGVGRPGPEGPVKASPLARTLAERYGMDIRTIRGSGPEGRVVKRDVEKSLAEGTAPASGPGMGREQAAAGMSVETGRPGSGEPAPGTAGVIQPAASPPGDRRVPISRKRRIIAERLSESKYTAPHYYLKISVEADRLLESRAAYNARAKDGLSFNAFLIKLVAEAIKKHPHINASWQENDILVFGSIDIGLAVAQKDGLITPVIRNCGNKGVVLIDRDIKTLVAKARNNELSPDEYTGATFTISNLGTAGIKEFTAIINPPGSAILAVGSVQKKPIVTDTDEVAVRKVMTLSLSCDHRVIDGAVGADFLAEIKAIIEDPIKALF